MSDSCNHCGGYLIEKASGPHVGLYCAECGKWNKWIKKSESKGDLSMSFQINYDDAFEGNDLIPVGEYEVIVKKAEEKETKDGLKKYISIQLAVRNDIDQKYKNKVIFESMFKKKDTGKYIPKQFNSIAKALKIPNGKSYNSLDELLKDWENKTARVRIKHEEYNGNTNARVNFWNESKFSECNHTWKDLQAEAIDGFTQLSGQDDDIPW